MNSDRIQQQLIPTLKQQLAELARAAGTGDGGAGTITQTLDDSQLTARITATGQLACEVALISVSDPLLGNASAAQLQALADRLARRLTYLEERLVVLEIDTAVPLVQMRSQPPRVEGSARSYFEVRVGRSGLSVQRMSKEDNRPRKATSATLTHDVFLRVCADLVMTIKE